ncbi:FliM/FliN family flagellar motor switch protein [uncultured Limimaricola sp.]|uniref:flagellar motor switch protein FliM n=1 Tax=uncultured Limimaricola sp. TaxID=2211667 RepID=UPI0030F91E49
MIQRTLREPEGGLTDGSIEEQIIQMASLSYERLPLLEAIFDRYALALGSAFKTFAGMPSEAVLTKFDYLPCASALEAIGTPALTAVARAEPWDGRIGVSMSPDLLFSVLEIMLGGRGGSTQEWKPRSFTAIERRFGQRLAEMVLAELEAAFEPAGGVKFRVDHLESSPTNAVLAPPNAPAVRITLKVSLEDRGGTLDFVIPDSTLETVRPMLSQNFPGADLGGDNGWREALGRSISGSEARITAVLHEVRVGLRTVLDWAPGDVIDLGVDMDHEATVSCNGQPMFRAAMGRRKNGAVALRVTDDLGDQEKERAGDLAD